MSTEGGPPLGAKKQPILPNLPATSRSPVKPHTLPLSHAFCREKEQKARLRYSAAVPDTLPPPASRPPPVGELHCCLFAAFSWQDSLVRRDAGKGLSLILFILIALGWRYERFNNTPE